MLVCGYTYRMWQDYVIAAVQWTFVLALIPTIRHPINKPAFLTSLLTAVLMLVLGFAFSTLKLWNGVASSIALGMGWGLLAYQRYVLDRAKPPFFER